MVVTVLQAQPSSSQVHTRTLMPTPNSPSTTDTSPSHSQVQLSGMALLALDLPHQPQLQPPPVPLPQLPPPLHPMEVETEVHPEVPVLLSTDSAVESVSLVQPLVLRDRARRPTIGTPSACKAQKQKQQYRLLRSIARASIGFAYKGLGLWGAPGCRRSFILDYILNHK